MEPVMFEEVEKDENVPKLLCQMDNHLGKKHLPVTLPLPMFLDHQFPI
jgi:hypothetical protein